LGCCKRLQTEQRLELKKFQKPIDKSPTLWYTLDRKREVNKTSKRKEVKIMKTVNERIEAIERELFIMEFKEHWDAKDWARRNELNRELAELRG
jgi:hypothetical protein